MIQHLYKLLDNINGTLTGRDPELVRRLREEIVVALETKKLEGGFFKFFDEHTAEYYPGMGQVCGSVSRVYYKNNHCKNLELKKGLDYISRSCVIRADLTERAFVNPSFSKIDHYIIIDDIEINSKTREATYQGIASIKSLASIQ
ncbi:MAG: hypothetical protein AABX16_02475 [Nanoarchaeota archaeon]